LLTLVLGVTDSIFWVCSGNRMATWSMLQVCIV
jgi:hypothetical protein